MDEPPPTAVPDEVKEQYRTLVREFAERVAARGQERAASYYWYHTIDLGDGLVTPGDYDFRPALTRFPFPTDMRGMRVLDVGSATGFFAFEFEKRGADVTAVDLRSIADWDMPNGQRPAILQDMKAWCRTDDLAQVDEIMVHGGFDFCHRLLNSRVKRCLSSIYDLSAEKLGGGGFDLVFAGDMLVHTMAPLAGLNVLAELCRGTLIISQDLPEFGGDVPLMLYYGGDKRQGDSRSWWHPNQACWVQMLKRLGFRDVEIAGHHEGVVRREWICYNRAILVATK